MRIRKTEKGFILFRKSRFKILFGFMFLLVCYLTYLLVSGYYGSLKHGTYLPDINNDDLVFHPAALNHIELENPWYILLVDEEGRVAVKTHEDEVIMSGLSYYSKYEDSDEKWGLDSVSVKLENDSTISISGTGHPGVFVNVFLTVSKVTPKVDINIRTYYNIKATVRREAFIAKFDVAPSEIYLKNRKVDFNSFDSEYWLQRQGVRFGKGSRSSLVYNTPHISSLQLNTKENLLFINLEYFLDHPHIQIPYQQDAGGKWIDLSTSIYSSGAEREDYFSIYFGSIPDVIPRLMLVPQGYLAGYVFTEHADGGNIRTHRAAYFGDESITDIENAVGGFAGHRIPVTKSVFYSDSSRNSLSGSSIRDDPDKPQFLDFLDQLNATGRYDICLHTPEQYSSNRESLAEAIAFMKSRFNTSTWIDHGMYRGKINRESFVCDGLNPKSEFYAADLWEKYDTRYFWNTEDESFPVPTISLRTEIKNLRFKNISAELWKRFLYQRRCNGMSFYSALIELFRGNTPRYETNSLQPFKGNSYPTPLYWQSPTRTMRFYSWVTNYDEDYSALSTNRAEFQLTKDKRQLDLLINNWGVFINHAYFVRHLKEFVDILTDNNGKLVINPFFDKILGFMSDKRDKGDLYITTIRDLLDYWILLEKISFVYGPSGVINVYNNNDKPLNGLSLVLHADANAIRLNGEIPKFRQMGEDTIIWFDIPAKGNATLQVVR